MAVSTTCRPAHAQMLGGNLSQALSSLEEAINMATRVDGKQFPVVGYAYVYMGAVYYEWNDLSNASYYLERGIEKCKSVGYLMDQAVGYVYLARVKGAVGELQGAQETLQNAQNIGQKMKGYLYVQRWVDDGWVRYWADRKDLKALVEWVQICGLSIDDEFNFMRDIEHIILARAYLALAQNQTSQNHLEDALILLGRLRNMAETAGWDGKLIEILALRALTLKIKGDEEGALRSLGKALRLAESEGYVRTFIDEGQPMAELLQLASSRGITPDYTRRLLAAYEPVRKMEQLGIAEPLVEPLSERELDVLRLLATDLSGPEIARELSVALSTVRYHSNNIYGKLAVHNRRAAVRKARELNLI